MNDLAAIVKAIEEMAKQVDKDATAWEMMQDHWAIEWTVACDSSRVLKIRHLTYTMYFYSDHARVICYDIPVGEYYYSDPDFLKKVGLLFQGGNKGTPEAISHPRG